MNRPESVVIREICDVYCELSPENLTHDGELPDYIVNREERRLTKKLQVLFTELGRELDEEQAWRLSR
jgi:hypothetical protein